MKRILFTLLLTFLVIVCLRLWVGNASKVSKMHEHFDFSNGRLMLVGVDIPKGYESLVDESLMDIVYPMINEELKVKNIRVITPDVIMNDWEKYATERNFDWWDKTQMAIYASNELDALILGVNVLEYNKDGYLSNVVVNFTLIDAKNLTPLVWEADFIYRRALGDKENLLRDCFKRAGKEIGGKRK